jgi:PhnB protein
MFHQIDHAVKPELPSPILLLSFSLCGAIIRCPSKERLMAVGPIPQGYRSATPYLAIDGAARAIDFYKQVFGARERMRMPAPGGKVGHAEIEIGDSVIMLADPWPEGHFLPPSGKENSVSIHLYVENADTTFARAVNAGAKVTQAIETKFYGDRSGSVRDPFGHLWHIATHVEDVPEDEMRRRLEAAGPG